VVVVSGAVPVTVFYQFRQRTVNWKKARVRAYSRRIPVPY
jgi:hypothetical protein